MRRRSEEIRVFISPQNKFSSLNDRILKTKRPTNNQTQSDAGEGDAGNRLTFLVNVCDERRGSALTLLALHHINCLRFCLL